MKKIMRFICLWSRPLGWVVTIALMEIVAIFGNENYSPRGRLFYTTIAMGANLPSLPDSLLFPSAVNTNDPFPNSANEELLREVSNENLMEETLYQTSDERVEALMEYWEEQQEKRTQRWDINSVTYDELAALDLLSPLALRNFFLERHHRGGRFHSLAQLKFINGWDANSLRKILPYLTIHNVETRTNWREVLTSGKWQLLLAAHQTVPRKEIAGHSPIGHPIGVRGRISYSHSKRYSFGIMVANSPFEPIFQKGYSPLDRCSFHASVALPEKLLQRVIIGDFRLNMGLGLVAGEHFLHPLYRRGTTLPRGEIVKATLANDQDYSLRGIGTILGNERLRLTLFYSSRKRDARSNDTEGLYTLTLGGLHRTELEMMRRATLTEQTHGARLQYQQSLFSIGVNALSATWGRGNALTGLPRYAAINRGTPIEGTGNLSLDYRYSSLSGSWNAAGEIAMNNQRKWAIIQRIGINTTNWGAVSLTGRYLSPQYTALYGKTLTHYTTPGNEWGIALQAELPPIHWLTPYAMVDFFGSLQPRYRQREKSKGLRIEGGGAWTFSPQWTLLTALRYQREEEQDSYLWGQAQLLYSFTSRHTLRFFGRFRQTYEEVAQERHKGVAVGIRGDIASNSGQRFGAMLCFFSTDRFDERLWLPLHRIRGFFTATPFYGNGWYGDLYARLPLGETFELEGKVAYTHPLAKPKAPFPSTISGVQSWLSIRWVYRNR